VTRMEASAPGDTRPVPAPDEVPRFYWDAAAERRLVLTRCLHCQKLHYPPEICCVQSPFEKFEAVEVTVEGFIYSCAAVDRALHAGFLEAPPYVVVVVELDDQPELRILANLVDVPAGSRRLEGAGVANSVTGSATAAASGPLVTSRSTPPAGSSPRAGCTESVSSMRRFFSCVANARPGRFRTRGSRL
jgi:uncharacterized protein